MEIIRIHNREFVKKRVDFRVTAGDVVTTAVIMDFSQGGAKIACYGRSFMVGTTLNIDSVQLDLHKKSVVVWNKALGNSISLTGLQFTR